MTRFGSRLAAGGILLGASISLSGCGDTPSAPTPPPPPPAVDPVDVNAGWIERLPRIPYVFQDGDPVEAGWPSPGQTVTWRAHVRAWGEAPLPDVEYVWRMDGAEVERGRATLPNDGHTQLDLDWSWELARHELELELDPGDEIEELTSFNNRLAIFTDALTIGFTVERGVYDFLHETQRRLAGYESNSFEDWAQRQILIYNGILGARSYPGIGGVLDRVRLDRIEIIPDGTLGDRGGLTGGEVSNTTVDMSWGFPRTPFGAGIGLDALVPTANPTNLVPFAEYRVLFHEMMHERGLTDLYAYRVFHGAGSNGSFVLPEEDGAPVAGTYRMPAIVSFSSDWIQVFEPTATGLMDQDYTFVSLVNTLALNRWAGRRTPWEIQGTRRITAGDYGYVDDLPARNRIRLIEPDGTALAGATVQVFQDSEVVNFYANVFDETPDITVTADGSGIAVFGRNPFGPVHTPDTSAGLEYKPATMLLRIEHQGRVAYEWVPAYLFNIEYWLGNETVADYDLTVTFRSP